MKLFLAAIVVSVLAAITTARPSEGEVVYDPHHHHESFLGSLSHVLKESSRLLHTSANLGGNIGALLHSSNLAAHGHEHHPVAHAPAVYEPDHSHISVYPSAHPPIQVSTYSSLHNEV